MIITTPLRPIVPLSESEKKEAEECALNRHNLNRALGTKHVHGDADEARGRDNDLVGAYGERAFAKFSGEEWHSFLLRFKGMPDVGKIYEVRSTWHPYGNLLLHNTDPKDRVFILARVLDGGDRVELAGWIYAREGIFPRYKWPGTNGNPCYKFPADQLRPMATLPKV